LNRFESDQGNKGTGEQGNKGTREQGIQFKVFSFSPRHPKVVFTFLLFFFSQALSPHFSLS